MSKLSLHISDWLDPDDAFDFIAATRPPIVKVFGNVGLNDTKIAVAKQRSPATTFVGRMYFPGQEIERDERAPVDSVFNYDPISDARNAFNQMREIMEKLRGLVDVWEGYNEIPIDTPAPLTERERQKARNFNAFTVEIARLMHDAGMKYAAYSFSTGNPVHIELWDLLLDGLRASDYLALHEYIAPNQQFTEFNTTMCNRYREVYTRIPADARKPVLITECGVDYNGEQGYKGKLPRPEYLKMLADYDRELMRDPYVVGAAIYCYGVDDKRWVTYDIGGEFARNLREYIIENPTLPIEIPPIVQIPVTPRAPETLRLADAVALAKQARDKLQNGDGAGAYAILKVSLVPWFYASAPQHSSDLPNAQAHTTARWYCEEAVRRIEKNENDGARELLDTQVLPWLESPGPRDLGILSVSTPKRKKRTAKKLRAKKGLGTLAVTSKPKRAAKKKKSAPKPKRKTRK